MVNPTWGSYLGSCWCKVGHSTLENVVVDTQLKAQWLYSCYSRASGDRGWALVSLTFATQNKIGGRNRGTHNTYALESRNKQYNNEVWVPGYEPSTVQLIKIQSIIAPPLPSSRRCLCSMNTGNKDSVVYHIAWSCLFRFTCLTFRWINECWLLNGPDKHMLSTSQIISFLWQNYSNLCHQLTAYVLIYKGYWNMNWIFLS